MIPTSDSHFRTFCFDMCCASPKTDIQRKTLIQALHDKKFEGASVYKLDKVAYVMTTYVHTKRENYWEFGLYDIDKKLIKCNRIIPNKNKQSENALTVHTSQTGAEQMWQLVHKYVPHAKRVGRSFEDYAG